jgi:hypothetical protein
LSPNGESILEEQGLNFINPVAEGNMEKVPSVIRDVLEQKEKEWMQQQEHSVAENNTRSQLKGIGYITSKVCGQE